MILFLTEISTHTLTWSVTGVDNYVKKIMDISTHTLTWSVTPVTGKDTADVPHFNSHAHVERDLCNKQNKSLSTDFNSHAHVERDLAILVILQQISISTHTLTWSVTLKQVLLVLFSIISTHTLTWSVTIPDTMLPLKGNISTHTLTWSVTKTQG